LLVLIRFSANDFGRVTGERRTISLASHLDESLARIHRCGICLKLGQHRGHVDKLPSGIARSEASRASSRLAAGA
jgi:hypothetical protein